MQNDDRRKWKEKISNIYRSTRQEFDVLWLALSSIPLQINREDSKIHSPLSVDSPATLYKHPLHG
jgi:hypothetical protein